eukprot:sb/3478845/
MMDKFTVNNVCICNSNQIKSNQIIFTQSKSVRISQRVGLPCQVLTQNITVTSPRRVVSHQQQQKQQKHIHLRFRSLTEVIRDRGGTLSPGACPCTPS